jgi:hypothetical protein
MDLATQPVTEKNRDAYYWRLLATAASFALFGLGGLCLRLVIFPLLGCCRATPRPTGCAPGAPSAAASGFSCVHGPRRGADL